MPKIDIENPRITFARVVIKVDGSEILAKSIQYGDSVEFAQVEGNSRMSLGTTDGQYKADEASMELYADDAAELIERLGDKFYDKVFTVSVAFEKSGSSKLTQDELIGCRMTKRAVNDQSGSDALMRTFSFMPSYLKMNGKNPLSKMPTGAK